MNKKNVNIEGREAVSEKGQKSLLRQFAGKDCRVFLVSGVVVTGKVSVGDDCSFIQVEGRKKSCVVNRNSIASIVEV